MAKIKDCVVKSEIRCETIKYGTLSSWPYVRYHIADYVYVEDINEYEEEIKKDNGFHVTDFATATSAGVRRVWTRQFSYKNNYGYYAIGKDGKHVDVETDAAGNGVFPCLALDTKAFISTRTNGKDYSVSTVVVNGEAKHFIEIKELQYPQTRVDRKTNKELEKLYKDGTLEDTGKTFTAFVGNAAGRVKDVKLEEYTYKGECYVRVKVPDGWTVKGAKYSNGKKCKEGEEFWVKVEPIKWQIQNWEYMPKEINPESRYSNSGSPIRIRSDKALFTGMMHEKNGEDLRARYQNSKIRAYLNGYDIHNELSNGNGLIGDESSINYSYAGAGFLSEIDHSVVLKLQKVSSSKEDREKKDGSKAIKKTRIEQINPDTLPNMARRKMTDTEKIKAWIDNGESVLLRGPSGIGKTQRLREMYPDIIELKLTDHMFPETVLGSVNFQEGQLIPPNFAREAIMQCANEKEKEMVEENISRLYKLADQIYERSKSADGKVVILMDELLNVKPAVQSLVFGIVLNRIVESNGRSLKLPANVVIVATGNQQKFSSSASELVSPLEKRFDHVLDMEPKVGEWLKEYAIPRKLHPAVISYIFSKYQENEFSEDIDKMSYFYEDIEVGEKNLDKFGSRGKTNDPRGWTAISQILYNFEEDLKNGRLVGKNVENYLRATLKSKLRDEWATEFFDFYNRPTITVEKVVNKTYKKEELPKNESEKFIVMAGLLTTNEKQVEACRNFVKNKCGPEYLLIYDRYWVGNDKMRFGLIGKLKAKFTLTKEKDIEVKC